MSEASWVSFGDMLRTARASQTEGGARSVVYLPAFAKQSDYDNHFHRACWYLPRLQGVVDRVVLGTEKKFARDRRPAHFCKSVQPTDHIVDVAVPLAFAQEVANAALILVWAPLSGTQQEFVAGTEIQVLNVATDDAGVVEYGNYCKAHWTLMTAPQRRALLQEGHGRFRALADKVWSSSYKAAAVFGTGPSVDRAFEFDFSNCYTHVCNTIVGSEALLSHIKPDLVSAGDVVSHFGVSLYAERFRRDLVSYMTASDAYFMTTAAFGVLLMVQHPEIRPKMMLADQMGPVPNYNLIEEWGLPGLDSVLNIHMLPAASTLFNNVFILGCDGKNPDATKNEDFWPHSQNAQYHELVGSGHQAHPMFDVHRQQKTWTRFKNSVRESLVVGERHYGKRYQVLAPSFTPGLDTRYVAQPEIRRIAAA